MPGGAFGSSLGGSFGGSFGPSVGPSASPVARVGDKGSHSHVSIGTLLSGSPTTRADGGKAVCRVGDSYLCPVHGLNTVVSGSGVFRDNGAAVARVGDMTQCGATIDTGSPTWSCA